MIAKLTGTKVLGYDNVNRLGSVFTKPVCWPNAAETAVKTTKANAPKNPICFFIIQLPILSPGR
ncbi:MAG TPA: hypothetical protein DDW24_10855 [Blastocatellia bacterium]|nr:hypothetical protein [Blastocatellia bacterium]